MSQRSYSVIVAQEFYREFEVKASSAKAARGLIEEMTLGHIEETDPRIALRVATGIVGDEKILRVERLP